ncbi:hypothetical protein B0H14DRAFT_2656500 [Mycena olivaceomarginata]|nr:hypothetical protein B0H14DRAFT_2656500 [Mycena olivaceomarginata]
MYQEDVECVAEAFGRIFEGIKPFCSALSGAKGRDGWWLEIFVGDHCAVPKPRRRAVDGPGQMNYSGERVPDVRCGRNDDDHWGWWCRGISRSVSVSRVSRSLTGQGSPLLEEFGNLCLPRLSAESFLAGLRSLPSLAKLVVSADLDDWVNSSYSFNSAQLLKVLTPGPSETTICPALHELVMCGCPDLEEEALDAFTRGRAEFTRGFRRLEFRNPTNLDIVSKDQIHSYLSQGPMALRRQLHRQHNNYSLAIIDKLNWGFVFSGSTYCPEWFDFDPDIVYVHASSCYCNVPERLDR